MALPTKDYYKIIVDLFEENANPEKAVEMAQYLRNQFDFYGLPAPIRRDIQKQIIVECGYPTALQLPELLDLLWANPHREMQSFGLDLVTKLIKKVDRNFIEVVERLITTKSWWDTVDLLATHGVGNHFRRFPDMVPAYPDRWMASKNIWLQRTAIIYQLKYKKATDWAVLADYILQLKSSDEFFIQKAAGWALREYSKTDWETVVDFIKQHELAPLTEREGLKWLKKKGVL